MNKTAKEIAQEIGETHRTVELCLLKREYHALKYIIDGGCYVSDLTLTDDLSGDEFKYSSFPQAGLSEELDTILMEGFKKRCEQIEELLNKKPQ